MALPIFIVNSPQVRAQRCPATGKTFVFHAQALPLAL